MENLLILPLHSGTKIDYTYLITMTCAACGGANGAPWAKGRMKPYLPELTIRDYNIYLQYLRGGGSCTPSLAGIPAICCGTMAWCLPFVRQPLLACGYLKVSVSGCWAPLCWRRMMPDAGHPAGGTGGSAAGWYNSVADRRPDELRLAGCGLRCALTALLRRAYERVVQQNPALERLFGQERDQVQMNLNAKNYNLAAEPMSNASRRAVFHLCHR